MIALRQFEDVASLVLPLIQERCYSGYDEAQLFYFYAICLYESFKYDKALSFLLDAVELLDNYNKQANENRNPSSRIHDSLWLHKITQSTNLYSKILYEIALCEHKKGNIASAINYCRNSIAVASDMINIVSRDSPLSSDINFCVIAESTHELAVIYQEKKHYDECETLLYYILCFARYAYDMRLIGSIYHELGITNFMQSKYSSGLRFFLLSIKTKKLINNQYGIKITQETLAGLVQIFNPHLQTDEMQHLLSLIEVELCSF